jgi:hypothetical protein
LSLDGTPWKNYTGDCAADDGRTLGTVTFNGDGSRRSVDTTPGEQEKRPPVLGKLAESAPPYRLS